MMKNLHLKLLAILCAVVLWVIVVGIENNFYVFPEPLEIQTFNLPEDVVVSESVGTAKLTLQVSGDAVKKLSAKDFEVYIDLQGAGAGERTAEVSVGSKNPEVRVLKVEPSIVKVLLEEIAEKEIPVSYSVKGDPAEGYEVVTTKLNKENLTIKGGKKQLSEITEAQATLTLSGNENNTVNKQATVKILNAEGDEIEVNTNNEEDPLTATITIKQVLNTKTVGIKPTIEGDDSKWFKKISISPNNIVLKGKTSELTKIDFLRTNEISASELKRLGSKNARIIIPQNVSLAADEPSYVTVSVEMIEIEKAPPVQPVDPVPAPEPKKLELKDIIEGAPH